MKKHPSSVEINEARRFRLLILQSLGLTLTGRKMPRWSHRNYYCAMTVTIKCDGDLRKMEKNGLLQQYMQTEKMTYFAVTQRGIYFAGVDNRVRKEDRIDDRTQKGQ